MHGYKLAPEDCTSLPAQQHNYKSATSEAHKPKVEQTILGKIADGNHVVTDIKPTIISALGAIPKPDSSEVRLIHDCSRPPERALNDYISCSSFKFQTLDDAIKMLQPNYFTAKIDLRHAYRSVPIHKSNYVATGLQWHFAGHNHPTYFFDTRLPFGAKSSPDIFHTLTRSVRRMMERRGFKTIIVYLDDFLIIGETKGECQQAFTTLLQLLIDLGFQISWHKVIGPTQKLVFLGVELDTAHCEMALPPTKLTELHHVVSRFLFRRRASKNNSSSLLASSTGHVGWCMVVEPSCAGSLTC